jgi:DNA gyrase subunit A
VSENGYGKRTQIEDFPTKGRGGKGLIAMSTSERNGNMVGAVQVFEGDELMLISNQGTLVRTRADEVSILSRNTQGVRVIRTKEGESLVGVQRIDEPAEIPELETDSNEDTAE